MASVVLCCAYSGQSLFKKKKAFLLIILILNSKYFLILWSSLTLPAFSLLPTYFKFYIYWGVIYCTFEILFLVCISTFQLIFRYRKKDTCSYTYTCACKYSIDTSDKSKLLNSNKYHVSIFSELNTDLNGFPFLKIPKQLEFSEVKMKARLLL